MQAPIEHHGRKPHWQPRPSTLRVRSALCFLVIDLLSIALGFGAAAVIRTELLFATDWIFLLLTLLPLYLLAAANNHAYGSDNLQRPFLAVSRGLQAITFAVAATVLVGFALKASQSVPRTVAILGFLLASGLLFLGRYYFSRHFRAIIGGSPFSVLLIRDGDLPIPNGPFSVIVQADGHLDPETDDPVMYDRLSKTMQSADRVVVACLPERRAAWSHALKGVSVQGEIVFPEFASLAPLGVDFYGDTPTMIVSAGPLGLMDRIIKRGFDLVVASGALFALAPFLVIVAIAIKLDSRGSIFFHQIRIGRDNQMFRILKFRSLHPEHADSAANRLVTRDDDRVTRIGQFIRATSIDELPQLLNVLKGDMSILGLRPHAKGARAANKLYWEVDRRYWHRHAAKPGLTGLAQVRGFRGATVVEADLSNRLQADLEYLEHWTIWRDVKIILLTFRVLLHRNAF